MLVKKDEITKITMLDNEHNDFCVVFHLGDKGRDGQVVLPCFFLLVLILMIHILSILK